MVVYRLEELKTQPQDKKILIVVLPLPVKCYCFCMFVSEPLACGKLRFDAHPICRYRGIQFFTRYSPLACRAEEAWGEIKQWEVVVVDG